MDNAPQNQNENQSPTLDEKDILPTKLEDRDASSPMGTFLSFFGLAVMTDLTIDAFDAVGSMGGGLTMPEMLGGSIAPEMAAELTNDMQNAMALGQPAAPSFKA